MCEMFYANSVSAAVLKRHCELFERRLRRERSEACQALSSKGDHGRRVLVEQHNNIVWDCLDAHQVRRRRGCKNSLERRNDVDVELLTDRLCNSKSSDVAGAAYNILGLIAKSDGNIELATAYFRQAGNVAPNAATNRDVASLLFDNGAYTGVLAGRALRKRQ